MGKGNRGFTPEKAESIARVAKNIGVHPNDLAAVISFETAGTFDPSIRNPKSSATGLIQFMKGKNGTYYGMSRDEFGSLSFDRQMDYVERYFRERGFRSDKEQDLASVYNAVTGVPKGGYREGTKAYNQNRVWDTNRDGVILPGEAIQSRKFREHIRNYFPEQENNMNGGLPKGNRGFTPEKAESIARVAKNIGVHPNDLAAVISFETAGTFDLSIRNPDLKSFVQHGSNSPQAVDAINSDYTHRGMLKANEMIQRITGGKVSDNAPEHLIHTPDHRGRRVGLCANGSALILREAGLIENRKHGNAPDMARELQNHYGWEVVARGKVTNRFGTIPGYTPRDGQVAFIAPHGIGVKDGKGGDEFGHICVWVQAANKGKGAWVSDYYQGDRMVSSEKYVQAGSTITILESPEMKEHFALLNQSSSQKNHQMQGNLSIYGISKNELSGLSFDKQMEYVEQYFKDRGFQANKKQDLVSVYNAAHGVPSEMMQSQKFREHVKNYFPDEPRLKEGEQGCEMKDAPSGFQQHSNKFLRPSTSPDNVEAGLAGRENNLDNTSSNFLDVGL